MIPWTLIILGVLLAILGALGLLAILLLPIFDRFEIVFDKDKDILQVRTDSKFGKIVWKEKQHLTRDFFLCLVIGLMMFWAGFYLGYAAKGENFWLYRKIFPGEVTASAPVWDKINDKGQYVASDGAAYTYYVLVSGNEISLSGEKCENTEDFRNRLLEINRDNTVIIYDSFAVSSTYHAVEALLNELGFDYEEER